MLRRVVTQKLTDVSEVLTASIIRAMSAVRTSDTSVNFYQTERRDVPEDIFILATVRASDLTELILFISCKGAIKSVGNLPHAQQLLRF
jgi:hypothetical protein